MSSEIIAAIIAASISFLTLIGTLVTQFFGFRATKRNNENMIKATHEDIAATLDEQRIRTLNERFATAADRLGSDKPSAVRLAGVYAMAGLADDWEENRQTCVDVLCAFLRLPTEPSPATDARASGPPFADGREIRQTVIRVIAAHLRPAAARSWQSLNFDFTGVVFGDDGLFSFGDAVFSGGRVSFDHAVFSGGEVDFSHALFSGGTVSFDDAQFSGGTVSFEGTAFSGAQVLFRRAQFSGGQVRFQGARFSGGEVRFTGASFSGGEVSFTEADFSEGTVSFMFAKFPGGTVGFSGARFSGATVDFTSAAFSGATIDLTARDWSNRPKFSPDPPHGVRLPDNYAEIIATQSFRVPRLDACGRQPRSSLRSISGCTVARGEYRHCSRRQAGPPGQASGWGRMDGAVVAMLA
jgi:uncharacterized protein YjbI with pentapeptide repeats